jgi:hypothetical protein
MMRCKTEDMITNKYEAALQIPYHGSKVPRWVREQAGEGPVNPLKAQLVCVQLDKVHRGWFLREGGREGGKEIKKS